MVDRSLDVVVFDTTQLYIERLMICIILNVVEKEIERLPNDLSIQHDTVNIEHDREVIQRSIVNT